MSSRGRRRGRERYACQRVSSRTVRSRLELLGARAGHLDRTRVVGAFPDGNSALNLAAARLRHIAGSRWATKRYLNIELLRQRNAWIA